MKNFIVCDCCKSKIQIGETYYILEAAGGETQFNCSNCVSHSTLEQSDVENFWEHHDEDDYDFDDDDDDDEFKHTKEIYGDVPDQDDK